MPAVLFSQHAARNIHLNQSTWRRLFCITLTHVLWKCFVCSQNVNLPISISLYLTKNNFCVCTTYISCTWDNWGFPRSCMSCARDTYVVHMRYICRAHEIHMSCTWDTYVVHMRYICRVHEIYVLCTWDTYVVCTRYMSCAWHNYDERTRFLWRGHVSLEAP